MLTASQISALRDQSEQLLDPIVDFLIEDIAKRISEAGQLTSTAAYEVWRAQNLGISQKKLKKELQKRLNISLSEVEKLLTQAAETGYNFDISRLPTTHAVPFATNDALQQILAATVKQARDDLTNMTQTMGFVGTDGNVHELTQAYQQVCDFAFQKVSTGAQDYQSAIRDATRGLAEKGIRTIDYDSGVHTSLEAAVRRNIMGGLGIMQNQISQQNHDDLGCDGWEISAHHGSAPDHEPYQGKQYPDAEYQRLNNSLVRPIGELNCGHAASPIILGVNSPQYTPEELEAMRQENEDGVTFDGKHYTLYEATQRQRKFERSIRDRKRRILVDETVGDKDKLQQDQIRQQVLKQEYARFSKGVGLPMQHSRMEKAGFTWKHGKAAEKAYKQNRTEDIYQVFKSNGSYRTEKGDFNLTEARKDYAQFLTSTPEKNRMLLEQSFNSVEYKKEKLKSAPFGYSPGRDKVLYDPTRSDFWQMDFITVNTHELAHRIDSFFVRSSENKTLQEAILNAQKTIKSAPEKYQAYCADHDKRGFLSDICSAISENAYDFPAGHPAEYWQKAGVKEKEVFANLFSMETFAEKENLDFIRDNFPDIFKAYQSMDFEVS